jgi:hypothetical protein
MNPSSDFVIFIIGLLPLGLFYGHLKSAFGSDGYFFIAAIGYLLVLRLLGRAYVGRKRPPGRKPD